MPYRNLMQKIRAQAEIIYKTKRIRDKTFDEFFESYLKSTIVPYWPVDWMKLDSLKRECFKDLAQKPKENKKPAESRGRTEPTSSLAASNQIPKERKSPIVNNNNVLKSSTSDQSPVAPIDRKKLKTEMSDITSRVSDAPNVPSTYSNSISAMAAAESGGNNHSEHETESPSAPKSKQTSNGSSDTSSPSKRASDHSINHIMSSALANELGIPAKRKTSIAPAVDSPKRSQEIVECSDDDCQIIESSPVSKEPKIGVSKIKSKAPPNERDAVADDLDITNFTATLNELKELQVG